jgi:hypothetical protein
VSAGRQNRAEAFRANALHYAVLTEPQAAWARMGSPHDSEHDGSPLLWLGANQIGKSYAQAWKLLSFIEGSGPFAGRRPGAVHICIVSISKEQIIPLMQKIWDLLDKRDTPKGERCVHAPGAQFEPGFGFRGKPPRINFTSGPGKGSTITFATYKQGSTRIAGATLDLLILDEPPPESLWGEVVMRLLRNAGQVWITMTITPDSPPQDWLKRKVDDGIVRFLHTELDIAAVTPIGLPAFLTKAQIKKAWDATPEAERPLRFGGAWSGAMVDRWFTAWGDHCVRTDKPPAGAKLLVCIDHSTSIGRQAACLMACVPGSPDRQQDARFWLIDEVVAGEKPTSTSIQEDAQNILSMLKRNGLLWQHIDVWLGDRAAIQTTKAQLKKDNAALRRRLADAAGANIDLFPRIEVPYKAGGTVYNGLSEMNARMVAPAFGLCVNPRCVGFIEAARRWNGDRRSRFKDILDSFRYGMETSLGGKSWHIAARQNRMMT